MVKFTETNQLVNLRVLKMDTNDKEFIFKDTNKQQKNIYDHDFLDMEKHFEYFKNISESFEMYLESNGIESSKVYKDLTLINKIIIRVDKRKEYFWIFSDRRVQISEIKEVALLAHGFLKYRPFTMDYNLMPDEKRIKINEGFAAFLIFGTLKEAKKRQQEAEKKPINDFKLSKEYIHNLMYAFEYWDISEEAMMLIVETLWEVC